MLTILPMLLISALPAPKTDLAQVLISIRIFRLKDASEAKPFFDPSEKISDDSARTSLDTENKMEAKVEDLIRQDPKALQSSPIIRTLENSPALISSSQLGTDFSLPQLSTVEFDLELTPRRKGDSEAIAGKWSTKSVAMKSPDGMKFEFLVNGGTGKEGVSEFVLNGTTVLAVCKIKVIPEIPSAVL